ncbi:protein-L-isoaspartate(D-aspartate) O-methyltransferase [Aureimonas fodinaquatilis]|uniref:protein-L-isoaspartate(D-aspartate) O-methyltransferase n=1 Tax=Aureimonas fodinaquatilis TaxID=2565783 RepID=UPI0011ED0B79|nr:protein-L-isoaspartate(D-aspartate) O-methyltransferase [Aureimonas fodinaquatilis]
MQETDREHLAAFLLAMRSQGGVEARLMEAVEAVPRRLFLPDIKGNVYTAESFPLPCGETIGSAELAWRCVMAMRIQPDSRILEIGTGSGYTTALLARMGARVTTLDRYKTLSKLAAQRMTTLGIENVTVLTEDGSLGWAEGGPYDRVIVHGVFEKLPKAFSDQMASHATLLCAIGPERGAQRLIRHEKAGSRFEEEVVGTVWWVPLKAGLAARL